MSPPGLADRSTVDKPRTSTPSFGLLFTTIARRSSKALDGADFYSAKREKVATMFPQRWAAEPRS